MSSDSSSGGSGGSAGSDYHLASDGSGAAEGDDALDDPAIELGDIDRLLPVQDGDELGGYSAIDPTESDFVRQ